MRLRLPHHGPLGLALLATTLALPAPTRGAEPAPAEVTLLFRWPDRASARVSFASSLQFPRWSSRKAPSSVTEGDVTTYRSEFAERLQTYRSVGTMRIDAERRGDEVRLSMRELEANGPPPPFSPDIHRSLVPAMLETVQVIRPDRTVARMERTAALREARERRDQASGWPGDEARYVFLAGLDLQRSIDLWNALLGDWAGRTFPLGVPVRGSPTGRLPCADLTVPHRSEILVREVPCGVAFPRTCVEIQARREADPAVLALAQARKDRSDAATWDRAPQEDAAYTGTIRLVTDPATLLPVHAVVEERYAVPGTTGGAIGCGLELDFAWDPPAGR